MRADVKGSALCIGGLGIISYLLLELCRVSILKNKAFVSAGVLFLMMLQYCLWFGEGGIAANFRLYADLDKQRGINQQFVSYNAHLAEEVKQWKRGDLSLIEAHARHDLGMLKPGETFYQLIN